MKLLSSLTGGLAGAIAVTLLHEIIKKYDPEAPRMDQMAMSAISTGFKKADQPVPDKKELYKYSLVGDLISNTMLFSLAGGKGGVKKALSKGLILGLTGGFSAVFAPKPLGLKAEATNKTHKTQVMSVAYYLVGGLVAGAVAKMVEKKSTAERIQLH
ncbi:hypothetical protein [Daejeonella oryzae]|uniref:hypothetical protein n=1 Tax=Daejeonella oryzae TaxID=1122943 RepID=UPI0003FE4521|nr:hypothetical protein [Daejeonella oryzae]